MSSSKPVAGTGDASNFPAPSGTKVATNRCLPGPEGCNPNGPQVSAYPVLLYNGFTYWPLSYEDNRVSFAIVITSGSTLSIVGQFEAPGSRYIDSIQVSSGTETVNFVGQSFDGASVSWSELAQAANAGTGTGTGTGTSGGSGTSTTPSVGGSATSGSSTLATISPGGSPSLGGGAIAGIAIGGVVGVVIICVVIGLLIKKCRRRTSHKTYEPESGAAAPPKPLPDPEPPRPVSAVPSVQRSVTPSLPPEGRHSPDYLRTIMDQIQAGKQSGHDAEKHHAASSIGTAPTAVNPASHAGPLSSPSSGPASPSPHPPSSPLDIFSDSGRTNDSAAAPPVL